jgi:hypothetical protein
MIKIQNYVHYPGLIRLMLLEPTVRENIEHLLVAAHDVSFESGDSFSPRDSGQMLQEQCTDAVTLMRVEHGQRNLSRGSRVSPDIPAHADESFVFPGAHRRSESDMVGEIQFGEAAEIGIAQGSLIAEKSEVHRARTQSLKVAQQTFLVIRPDRADQHWFANPRDLGYRVIGRILFSHLKTTEHPREPHQLCNQIRRRNSNYPIPCALLRHPVLANERFAAVATRRLFISRRFPVGFVRDHHQLSFAWTRAMSSKASKRP